jgi:putative transcriptional regulator
LYKNKKLLCINYKIIRLGVYTNFSVMNRIKEVLGEKGIKQKWLAEKLDNSFNTVNSYVQNRQQPRLEVLNEIAEILDVDIKELILPSK